MNELVAKVKNVESDAHAQKESKLFTPPTWRNSQNKNQGQHTFKLPVDPPLWWGAVNFSWMSAKMNIRVSCLETKVQKKILMFSEWNILKQWLRKLPFSHCLTQQISAICKSFTAWMQEDDCDWAERLKEIHRTFIVHFCSISWNQLISGFKWFALEKNRQIPIDQAKCWVLP